VNGYVEAIRRVLAGKVWLSEAMADRQLQRAVGTPRPAVTCSLEFTDV
jgi:hypothetical protein